MRPNIGDTVRVWKSVMGREYCAEGSVEELRREKGDPGLYMRNQYLVYVEGDWWIADNDLENRCEIVQPPDARCHQCGEGEVEMMPVDVAINYGEDGEPDDGGCFTEHHTEWQCTDHQACRDRRREMWKLSQTMARFADQEAAERGAFAIGGGVG